MNRCRCQPFEAVVNDPEGVHARVERRTAVLVPQPGPDPQTGDIEVVPLAARRTSAFVKSAARQIGMLKVCVRPAINGRSLVKTDPKWTASLLSPSRVYRVYPKVILNGP